MGTAMERSLPTSLGKTDRHAESSANDIGEDGMIEITTSDVGSRVECANREAQGKHGNDC
jgi:hypothetical protein